MINKPHLSLMLSIPDFIRLKYGKSYHKTTGSQLLVIFFPLARFSTCFFYTLVSEPCCPLLLISSAMILCFIAAAGVQNVRVAASAARRARVLAHPPRRSVQRRQRDQSSAARSATCRWSERSRRGKRPRLRCDTILSALSLLLPPLLPSHRSFLLVELLAFTPLLRSVSLSATFVTPFLSLQHLPHSPGLTLSLFCPSSVPLSLYLLHTPSLPSS